ncbi:MAG: DegT/DnrJ/EryC1/StrS family aminotransferase [Lachnospiraceae bacterium]|nr:DegT/DnrJ/EryC1/StrS family aminotransferase [Lachnospiraceae bacterium]
MSEEIYVTRASMPPLEDYVEEIRGLFSSRMITNMGEKYERLTEELRSFLGTEQLVLLANGHMSLELTLQAMKLKGEVITTPFTFASTTHAIVRSGLTPVFCDIREDNYTLDPENIEALITENTSAILPVHVYGNVCAVEEIDAIARKHHLKVIYDAAHSFGVSYRGRGIGNYGDAAVFSFHATKVFNTVEGGAAAFRDASFAEAVSRLANFGIISEDDVVAAGMNAKMNEFQAAMGLCNLRHFERDREARGRLWHQYREELADIPGVVCPALPADAVYNYSYFPIRIVGSEYGGSRDDLAAGLRAEHIYPRRYFYPLTSDYLCYRGVLSPGVTPRARRAAEEILTLPLYPDLGEEQVSRICSIIRGMHRSAK